MAPLTAIRLSRLMLFGMPYLKKNLCIFTVIFDMVRARENGILVPRYQAGRQLAVRGALLVGEVQRQSTAPKRSGPSSV